MITLDAHLRDHLVRAAGSGGGDDDLFDQVLALDGRVYRIHKHRRTIRATIGGRDYFVKVHRHAGWREVLKDALRLRRPIVTAAPEWRAIERFRLAGIPTVEPVGYGTRGRTPATRESFIITRALEGFIHLDELAKRGIMAEGTEGSRLDASMPRCADAPHIPAKQRLRIRRRAITEIAQLTRLMHSDGMNHRDLYLVHFMLPDRDFSTFGPDDALNLHVIDLHRVQRRKSVPRRWIVKDLAGLLFSSLDCAITRTDILRFLRGYWGDDWRKRLRCERRMLRAVERRAVTLYRSEHGRPAPHPAGRASS